MTPNPVLAATSASGQSNGKGGGGTTFTNVSVPGTGQGYVTSVTCGFLSGCQAKLEVPDSISGFLAALGLDAADHLANVRVVQRLALALPPIPTPPRPVKIAAGSLSKLLGGVKGIAMDLCAQHIVACYLVAGPGFAIDSLVMKLPGVSFTVDIKNLAEDFSPIAVLSILVQVFLDLISVDPVDPNFTTVLRPQPARVVALSGRNLTVALTAALGGEVQGLLDEVADMRSLVTSVNRAQGARHAGAYVWEYRQLQAVAEASAALARDAREERQASQTLATAAPWGGGSGLTAQQVSGDQGAVATQGLPAGVHQLLNVISAGDQERSVVNQIVSADPSAVASATRLGVPDQLNPAGATQAQQSLSGSLVNYEKGLHQLTPDNPVVGWAVGQLKDGSASAFHTDDGIHWRTVPLPQAVSAWQPTDVVFTTLREGWISATQGLLHTGDGGRTWHVAASGEYDSLQFPDELHGYAMGLKCAVGAPCATVLSTTVDGGLTWNSQSLGGIYLDFQFGDSVHGWLAGPDLHVTADGGKTWRSLPAPGGGLISVSFVDLQRGFALTEGGQLVSTADGGATWKTVTLPVNLFPQSIRFGGAGDGWIVGENNRRSSALQ
jgi:photosystem II stability/assembly factor-like uncharacterized protein